MPYESEPEREEPPTLDLTLPPPGGVTWRAVRTWAIVAIVMLATCLLVLTLIGVYRSEDAPQRPDQGLRIGSFGAQTRA